MLHISCTSRFVFFLLITHLHIPIPSCIQSSQSQKTTIFVPCPSCPPTSSQPSSSISAGTQKSNDKSMAKHARGRARSHDELCLARWKIKKRCCGDRDIPGEIRQRVYHLCKKRKEKKYILGVHSETAKQGAGVMTNDCMNGYQERIFFDGQKHIVYSGRRGRGVV